LGFPGRHDTSLAPRIFLAPRKLPIRLPQVMVKQVAVMLSSSGDRWNYSFFEVHP